MNHKIFKVLTVICITSFVSCEQNKKSGVDMNVEASTQKDETKITEPHRYGGWYCPDNLTGFPAIDIKNWRSVPVVNGRMATKEETQNGTSLIFVDKEKYPNAKPLEMEMPKLARYYNSASRKEEIIIVLQALNISNDSIVGFRYLNGGNGSARLNEVKILSNNEIDNLMPSRFVTIKVNINTTKDKIWKVLTEPTYFSTLKSIFDKGNLLNPESIKASKVNFKYHNAGNSTSEYAGNLYGNQYIQLDFESDDYQYVEKFLVSENQQTKKSELTIVCGPYAEDFETQNNILNNWAQKVKVMSEKQ